MTRRLTVLDRDYVFLGKISQSPPIPDSRRTHETSSQSDVPLLDSVEQSYSDHAPAGPSLSSRAPSVLVKGEDAPPGYQAPRVRMKDVDQKR
jgi:hypothetical protein